MFNDEQRTDCAKCHSVDGRVGQAGPDLYAVGDKFPRRELIRAALEPSAEIAVGYGTTILETRSGEEFQGILKEATADALELIGADGRRARIPTRDIQAQRGSALSLMPEGLQAGLSREEFTDLIEYLVTLKQPESALTGHRGMPAHIPELARPIQVRPFFSEPMRYPHNFVQKPGDVRSGLVWFGPLPGVGHTFLVVHQTGKIWRMEKHGTNELKSLFLYIGMGDTGPQQDPQGHGQDLTTHLGKILRIDVDRAEAGRPYAIPADNPFRDHPGARPEIWACGFREPWRFSLDPVTRDLWVGDVGQDRVEEVAIVRRGENQGWNVFEGFEPFSNKYRKEGASYVPPVFAYRRRFGNSITGGYVYRGDLRSSFYGVYICGDYTSRRIFGIKQHDLTLQAVRQIGLAPQNIASFATGERGEIHLVGYEGMICRLDLAGADFDNEAKTASAQP